MTRTTVKQLLEALEDQRAASENRIEQLEQKLAAQIEAVKPKSVIGHWISGIGATIALCGVIVALVGLVFNTNQQTEMGKKQTGLVAAQESQAAALTKLGEANQSQTISLRQMNCSMFANQAVSDMRANPKAANLIYNAMTNVDESCKTVGVPVLVRAAYLIDKNPEGIPRKISERAAQRLAALPAHDRSLLVDRFFLGESQLPGFNTGGVGPEVIRTAVDQKIQVGLRPSTFTDMGSVYDVGTKVRNDPDCQAKLDAEMAAKPNETSWLVHCKNGPVGRTVF